MRKLLILVLFAGFAMHANSQVTGSTIYNYESAGSALKFSMRIPGTWVEAYRYEGSGYITSFRDTSFVPDKKNKNCIDTALFRIKYIPADLTAAMTELGFKDMGKNMYVINMNDFTSVVVAFEREGNNYQALEAGFKTKGLCPGVKIKKGDAHMQYLLFSDGKQTVCVINNGIALSDQARKELLDSFEFK